MPRSGRSVSVKGKSLGLMVAPFDLPLNWVSVSPLSIYLGAGWLSPLQAAGRPFPATALRVGGRIVASPVVTPAPCLHRLVVPDLRGVSAGGTIGTLTTFAPSGLNYLARSSLGRPRYHYGASLLHSEACLAGAFIHRHYFNDTEF
uniref:Uncharacterized protein n=1 Tax=Opuntia streptacantha TaxID=393608 RepID=A0A7C9EFY4_OPUST